MRYKLGPPIEKQKAKEASIKLIGDSNFVLKFLLYARVRHMLSQLLAS